jgi:hypothetical protein
MVDVLQSNVVIFLQTLNKAIVDLSAQTGIMLDNIGGRNYTKAQDTEDTNRKIRAEENSSENKNLTESEKTRYAEIFGIFTKTNKFPELIKSFDKSISTFLKASAKQLTAIQKTNTTLQTNLKNLNKPNKTTTVTEPPKKSSDAPTIATETPKKSVDDLTTVTEPPKKSVDVKNPTLENLNKNVGIITTIFNKQYIEQQKKFDTLSPTDQPVKNLPSIIPKTTPVDRVKEPTKSEQGGFLSMLGSALTILIGGVIGAWILKNPKKAMEILEGAWEFIKTVGGLIWKGIKFITPYIAKFVDFIGPKWSGALLVVLTAFKLFGGSITGLVFNLTKLLGQGVLKAGKLGVDAATKITSKTAGATVQGAGTAVAKTGTGAAVQGAGTAVAKTGAKTLLRTAGKVAGGVGAVVLAGMEYQDRISSGQTQTQAIAGTAGTAGGALAGVAAGAAIGSVVPIVGTLVGGLIGGIAGSFFGGKVADTITGAADAVDDAAKNTRDTAKQVNDKIGEFDDIEKDTDVPDIDDNDNISSAYKEMTNKLIDVTQNNLTVSKLQLNELSNNGTKLDRIIEGLKNISLNNVTVNSQQRNNQSSSYMNAEVSTTKMSAVLPIYGVVNTMGGIA